MFKKRSRRAKDWGYDATGSHTEVHSTEEVWLVWNSLIKCISYANRTEGRNFGLPQPCRSAL